MSLDTKGRLLQAAAKVVAKDGAASLTLEHVASIAKVSKGGLLYHFPNKNALITGLIQGEIERFDAICEALRSTREPGSYVRAYLQATLADDTATAAGVLSAVANDPSLLRPLQDAYLRWQAALEADGIDPVIGTLVRLVADGLWFSSLVGAAPIKPKLLRQLIAKLQRLMTEEHEHQNA